jgi:signal transduction histidine kinase
MLSRLTARMAFAIAIGLLLVCAILVYNTVLNLAESERLVTHTHQVQELLGETESAIASAARARLSYVFSGDDAALTQYQRYVTHLPVVLNNLRQSTADNPNHQKHCDQLEALVNDRIQLWEKSVALKRSGLPSPAGQPDMTRQSVAVADEIVAVTDAMRTEETKLLQQRTTALHLHFVFAIFILSVTFIAAVLLLLWHYRLLRAELHAREYAQQVAAASANAAVEAERKAHMSESAALASQSAARRLSARLLQLRDDERRKFSRELHDSIGQYLAAAKMMLQSLANDHETDRRYSECVDLLDQSIKETRTISHLLHPTGLDEVGFSSAATWYAKEFAQRSGLQLDINVSEPARRLPREVEIALFRVLQEGLTNIHRHSKSVSAELIFEAAPESVVLTIRDQGVGIPKEVLDRFRSSGTSGVGLAGMRERIRELGGSFEVESANDGTSVRVVVPLTAGQAFAADPG